jgi:hypothetical protein
LAELGTAVVEQLACQGLQVGPLGQVTNTLVFFCSIFFLVGFLGVVRDQSGVRFYWGFGEIHNFDVRQFFFES